MLSDSGKAGNVETLILSFPRPLDPEKARNSITVNSNCLVGLQQLPDIRHILGRLIFETVSCDISQHICVLFLSIALGDTEEPQLVEG